MKITKPKFRGARGTGWIVLKGNGSHVAYNCIALYTRKQEAELDVMFNDEQVHKVRWTITPLPHAGKGGRRK